MCLQNSVEIVLTFKFKWTGLHLPPPPLNPPLNPPPPHLPKEKEERKSLVVVLFVVAWLSLPQLLQCPYCHCVCCIVVGCDATPITPLCVWLWVMMLHLPHHFVIGCDATPTSPLCVQLLVVMLHLPHHFVCSCWL